MTSRDVDSEAQLSAEARELEARQRVLSSRVAELFDRLDDAYFGAREALLVPLVHTALAGGHVLLEGLPGLGKTMLAKSLAALLGASFSRIQCTPDLMPSDVTGTEILEEGDGAGFRFRFRRGPVFGNFILADEINRATPKTQSALLEAMEEGHVTVGGKQMDLPDPFVVMGTQNPVEMEGTYPLPEAQLDRFALMLQVPYPDRAALESILDQRSELRMALPEPLLTLDEVLEIRALSERVLLGAPLRAWLAELLTKAQPGVGKSGALVKLGASPRAGIAMLRVARMRALLAGRFHLSREDLEQVAAPALRHRVLLGYEAKTRGIAVDELVAEWIAS